VGLLGIFVALAFLIFLAFRGWSILLLAPMAGLIAATFAAEPLLASWTQTFMLNAAQFVAQFFLCVPKIRFGVDGASGRRKLAS
jgi:H+/gluconate symporter-like permease